MNAIIHFRLNQEEIETRVDSEMTLLRYLREERRLTGTKNGCGSGHCGSCTVLIDGQPAKSCLLKMNRVAGRSVETIEGIGAAGGGPIQTAFLTAGAVQCGFCTPGMIMNAKALLNSNPKPDEHEIRRALSGVLCRCTGYQKIVEAVKNAASARQP